VSDRKPASPRVPVIPGDPVRNRGVAFSADQAIGQYEYAHSRSVYLPADRPGDIEKSFATLGLGAGDVDVIVCSDAGQVPVAGGGRGGGPRTATGKAALYTAAAGIHPGRVIPVWLDTGTGSEALRSDPFYLGSRRARGRGPDYDAFIDRYVRTVSALFPGALLHFAGFSPGSARKIVHGYGGYRVFSDGLQGTGTAVLAAVYAATRVTGIPLKHQEPVVCGAGADGVALADLLRAAMTGDGASDEQARSQIWLAGPHGLLFDDTPGLRGFQRDFAKQRSRTPWASRPGPVGLAEVIERVAPTILLATPAAGRTCTRQIIQAMCQATSRPLILPISAAAGATPADIIAWSDAKALVATGIPAAPVDYEGTTFTIAQASNALVYPGLGLGVIVSQAARITPRMLQAAAAALAEQADAAQPGAPLLPGLQDLRACAVVVAEAVVGAAVTDQVASDNPTNLTQAIHRAMWQPAYPDPRLNPDAPSSLPGEIPRPLPARRDRATARTGPAQWPAPPGQGPGRSRSASASSWRPEMPSFS
jgi:malate dehydrogenase (oxaloacetate-decarboxylating)